LLTDDVRYVNDTEQAADETATERRVSTHSASKSADTDVPVVGGVDGQASASQLYQAEARNHDKVVVEADVHVAVAAGDESG
jgi:hypothetical protein